MQPTQGSAIGEAFAGAGGGYSGVAAGAAVGEAFASAHSTIILDEVSQLGALALGASNPEVRVDQFVLITLGTIPARYEFMSSVSLLALTQITARDEYISQLPLISVIQGKVVEKVSQVVVLTLARTNPGKRQLRAFPFNQDGHTFYVLQLGAIGTVVYDQTTGKWSEWQSWLYNNWKANYGINWQSGCIAGSIDSNMLYDVDPEYMFDERALPIVSVITGGYPMRLRDSVACDEVMVTASVGYAPGAANSSFTLRTSDDRGLSWKNWGTLDMGAASPMTEVSWRSLGQISQPGRIFELTDNGGAAQSINSIEMFSRDVPNG